MNRKTLSRITFCFWATMSLLIGSTALPSVTWADSAGTSSDLEEVIVTATKTGAQSVQDVPVAITAFTSQMLQAEGAVQLSDLTHETPGFTYAANGPWAISTIRGVGTNNVFAGGDASTTLQVDGVYYGRPTGANVDFLDVDRVEILRGPQGTLYGRNADAGTINVITKDPTPEFSGVAQVSGGTYGLFRPEATVSGPIAGDSDILYSVAAFGSWRDAYVTELTPGLPNQWNENRDGVRAKLLFQIEPNLRLLLSSDYTDVNEYMNASYVRLNPTPFPDGTNPTFYQTFSTTRTSFSRGRVDSQENWSGTSTIWNSPVSPPTEEATWTTAATSTTHGTKSSRLASSRRIRTRSPRNSIFPEKRTA